MSGQQYRIVCLSVPHVKFVLQERDERHETRNHVIDSLAGPGLNPPIHGRADEDDCCH